MGKKKVGKLPKRDPHKFYYVDKQGNIWEMDRPKRKKKKK